MLNTSRKKIPWLTVQEIPIEQNHLKDVRIQVYK